MACEFLFVYVWICGWFVFFVCVCFILRFGGFPVGVGFEFGLVVVLCCIAVILSGCGIICSFVWILGLFCLLGIWFCCFFDCFGISVADFFCLFRYGSIRLLLRVLVSIVASLIECGGVCLCTVDIGYLWCLSYLCLFCF